MVSVVAIQHIETFSTKVADAHDALVMELTSGQNETVRVELPAWVVQQLMRALPHADAAIQQRGQGATASLIAYPILEWNVTNTGAGQLALWLRNDRKVDAAGSFSIESAVALHRELGDAIACAQAEPAAGGIDSCARSERDLVARQDGELIQ
jgi:hypothetical protein